MELNLTDLLVALPEIFLMSMIVIILLYESLNKSAKQSTLYILSLIGLFGTAALGLFQYNYDVTGGFIASNIFWFGEILYSPLITLIKVLMLLIVAFGLIYSYGRLKDSDIDNAEYYVLILLSTLGMMVLVAAGSILTVYVGLELMSLPMYGLVALNRRSNKGSEAAMKYFVMGAMSSGILLFGMALLYGGTGSLQIADIKTVIAEGMTDSQSRLILFSAVFLIVGTVFKLGGAPFHGWVPDVYEGAPAPVAMFIGAAPKVAAFMMGVIILLGGLIELRDQWQPFIIAVAIVSFVIGNLVALKQDNIRRMLGYSAVSHAGFILLGLLITETSAMDLSAGLFYAITYAMTTTAAFGFLLSVKINGRDIQGIDDLKGFAKTHAWYGILMAVVMLSMGGIPFFVGFYAKFIVLKTAFEAGYLYTVIVALLMSVIGLYYYLRVIKVMFFDEATSGKELTIEATGSSRVFFNVNALLLIVLGVAPSLLLAFL
ncbi:NADH-quinone oxidoreductase subunit N [Ignatzschineria sp. LJL83]